jgi:SOUL heme-binding protein
MKKKILLILLLVVLIPTLTQLYTLMASNKTEKQPYQVVKKEKEFEIRFYPSATMATVVSTASTYKEVASPGFRKLAGYIFGGNQQGMSIAMTAPVHMDMSETGSSMSFVMPQGMTPENLPKPNDPSVHLSTSKPEYVAVIRFGGYATDEDIQKHAAKLEELLQEHGIKHSGHFRFLGYNAPYQFLCRRNEVIVTVEWEGAVEKG